MCYLRKRGGFHNDLICLNSPTKSHGETNQATHWSPFFDAEVVQQQGIWLKVIAGGRRTFPKSCDCEWKYNWKQICWYGCNSNKLAILGNLDMCVYIYINISIYIYLCVNAYIYIYVYINMPIYLNTYIFLKKENIYIYKYHT